MDLRHLQAFLGHANLNTVAVYTQVGIKALKDLHQAMHPAAVLQDKVTPGEGVERKLMLSEDIHEVLEAEGEEEAGEDV